MPLPVPKSGQSQDAFIASCMAAVKGEFPGEKQRAAVCYKQWRGNNANKAVRVNSEHKITLQLDQKPERTPEGFLIVPVIIAAKTVLTYGAKENPDGQESHELLGDAIFDPNYLATADGCPFILDHPVFDGEDQNVKPTNYQFLIKGILYDPEPLPAQGIVKGKLKIFDDRVIQLIEEKKLRELSQGYTCDRIPASGTYNGQAYEYEQTNLVQNHIALVAEGRAGADVRVLYNSKGSMVRTGPKGNNQKKVDASRVSGIAVAAEDLSRLNRRNDFMRKFKANRANEFDAPGKTEKENEIMPEMNADVVESEEHEAQESGKLDKILSAVERMSAAFEKLAGGGTMNAADEAEDGSAEAVPKKNEDGAEGEKENKRNEAGSDRDEKAWKQNAARLNALSQNLPKQISEQVQAYTVARQNSAHRALNLIGDSANELAIMYPAIDDFNRAVLVHAGVSAEKVKRMNSARVAAELDVRAELAKESINMPRANTAAVLSAASASGHDDF